MLPETIAILTSVIDVLDRLQIQYLIGGSFATVFYGVARSTIDADIVADVRPQHVCPLIEALHDEFYIDEGMIREAIEHQNSFNLIHLKTMFKVDVFVFKDRPFDRSQFQRRVERSFASDPERKVFVTSPEDIILAKLEWYQLGNEISDRQWKDILGVLNTQAGWLDFDYLRFWANELSLADLLERAFLEME